jgi:ABC-type transporter Mla subunit MlaD
MIGVLRARGRKLLIILSVLLLFLGVVVVLLLVLPENRGPFDYMVAGTFATAIALTAIWALSARGAR